MKVSFDQKMTSQDITVNPVIIKESVSGGVYTTIKKYMNKLFNASGYKSVTTVTDLKELANYEVSTVEFEGSSVYANQDEATYIFCSDIAYEAYHKLFKVLDNSDCTYFRSYTADEYYTHDEYIIKNHDGSTYLVKLSLLTEKADIYKFSGGVTQYEATINMYDEDQSVLLPDIVRTPYDDNELLSLYPDDIRFTYAEVADILTGFCIMKKRKGAYALIVDQDNNVMTGIMNLMSLVVKLSMMTKTESSFTMTDFTVGKLKEFLSNATGVVDGSITVDSMCWIYDSIVTESISYFTNLPYNQKNIDDE